MFFDLINHAYDQSPIGIASGGHGQAGAADPGGSPPGSGAGRAATTGRFTTGIRAAAATTSGSCTIRWCAV